MPAERHPAWGNLEFAQTPHRQGDTEVRSAHHNPADQAVTHPRAALAR